jgi:hypothetical protein
MPPKHELEVASVQYGSVLEGSAGAVFLRGHHPLSKVCRGISVVYFGSTVGNGRGCADHDSFSSRSIRIRTRTGKNWLLVECHADPLFLAPDDMTGLVVPVCGEHQREMFGDANRAADVQRRPDILRTMQSIAPPPNSIVAAFNTRCRALVRFSGIRQDTSKDYQQSVPRAEHSVVLRSLAWAPGDHFWQKRSLTNSNCDTFAPLEVETSGLCKFEKNILRTKNR